jgi:sugar/nucleoside kinase (ribokinase family)
MSYDIIGIGNPLLDSTIKVETAFLEKHQLAHGTMTLIDTKKYHELIKAINTSKIHSTPGGSVANVLAAAQAIGGETLLIGCRGKDSFGETYERLLQEEGISSGLSLSDLEQGQCLVFITPNGERTFATYLGASLDLSQEKLDEDLIMQAKVLHIEGYQFDGEKNTKAILHAMDIAHKAGVIVSLDLSDPGVVARHKKIIDKVIHDYVHIIFANEAEAQAFTGEQDEAAAARILGDLCEIAVIKLGEKGSIIMHNELMHRIKGYKVDLVNTNGAGDTFAGVFLQEYLTGNSIKKAGTLASYAAAQVVAQEAAQLRRDIRKEFSE